jgi:hypothetical protein
MAEKHGRPVLVTTQHRGVFFGYLDGKPTKEQLTIKQARNCLYWSPDVKGFIGLAEQGPTKNCRVGPASPEMTLFNITAVVTCTPEAAAKWEEAPWK